MKKSRDAESSLELLLDTMCNSFGGVMFIAISLIIVLTMTSKVNVNESENYKNLEEMQAKLEELKIEFEKIKTTAFDTQRLLDQLKNDPRRKYLADIIKLEAMAEKLKTENAILQSEIQVQNKKNDELNIKKISVQRKLDDKKNKLQTITAENLKLEQELIRLREDLKKTAKVHMTFKVMSPSKKIPYFLIVNDSKIYRVGPDILNKEPHSDVSHIKVDDNIICSIKDASKGVPLLDGENISNAAAELLKNLPADRFPEFSIHSNSLRDFCKFRENLKKNNVTHSVNTYFESFDKQFIYHYSSGKGNYEAY